MAHHQHHGSNYEAHVSNSLQTESRPAVSVNSNLPAISEDDLAAEADEPPEQRHQKFIKFTPRLGGLVRRESLLTKALTTDSESHEDENALKSIISHNPSVSSTCSNFSNRSAGEFTSDDGHTSPGTRASTPSSPRSTAAYMKQAAEIQRTVPRITFGGRQASNDTKSDQPGSILKPAEPAVEAELGRKRCISFMCGGTNPQATATKPAVITPDTTTTNIETPKRQCAIKFLCPSKLAPPKSPVKAHGRIHSPAPPTPKTSSSSYSRRGHRDSDVTIKNESPKAVSHHPTSNRHRRLSHHLYPARTEATRFHEFGSSDDETEDWVQQSTCHRSRLTVTDTLKKENVIRQLAEEAEEEALEDEAEGEDDVDDSQTDFLSGEDEDAGFQTDDEEGFAESDEDSDDDSDYEWWAPRRSPTASPFISLDMLRKTHPVGSESSYAISDMDHTSPKTRMNHFHARPHQMTKPVAIRPGSPELPDSTDFVCGTLDEDRPLEQAYIISKRHREAARHRVTPQDIDPSFPASDPEIEQDDDEEGMEDGLDEKVTESDRPALGRGRGEINEDSFRGRRVSSSMKRSPRLSPRRLRSPAPFKRGRSPAPRGMFAISPQRMRSPPPPNRLTSPPPSRRGSYTGSPGTVNMSTFGPALLGMRNHDLTHTSSLPRSPHPYHRRRRSSNATAIQDSPQQACDDDEDTEEAMEKPYTRGAIDIVQGLECKRLKRREKLYRQYWKREEKKKNRRPQPGKGAERMRQVGIECAIYRGKRVLSV